jgi:ferredoxin
MFGTLVWTLAFIVGIGFFSWQLWGRFGVLLKLRKDDGRDYSTKTWSIRLKNMWVYAFGQKKFFRDDQPAGVMHIVIFWGFLTLSLQVITMFMRGWFAEFRIPGLGMHFLGGPYGLLKDAFEVGVLIAVGVAFSRWLITKPERLFGFLPAEKRLRAHSHWEALLILCFISSIMLSGLFYDAGRMVYLNSDPDMQLEYMWQPVSALLASFLNGRAELAHLISELSWWVHNLVILVFLNLLPRSKHFHIITAVINVFLGKVEPKGQLAKRDFTAEAPLFGRSTIDQFTWKQALDMYSCTECGRCSSNCPATATGKPLAPRQFLLDLRDHLYSQQPQLPWPRIHRPGSVHRPRGLVCTPRDRTCNRGPAPAPLP